MKIAWQVKHFKALNIDELYEILKLRIDVFVVEQTCFYADIDDIDRHKDTIHLFCYLEGKIAGYLRILAKGQSYQDYIAIGRVIVASHARGTGLGHQLMAEALTVCQQYFPDQQIKISAQEHLESFYGNHGFERVSAMYLEDDIPHIAMLKADQ
ncbi:GCN5 family acetyltransferase [Colwellia sp. PAMC 20917]|jgi:ElaA protein|uniref:GNAT family N-acetyltransferase n=1 Tax=unclassified Colwellia TaxID=196834 RepID=UPI000878C9AD|nr:MULTISPECIES: GNAT family N-acetyltransferase [unclassified Colwellia]AOW78172.1 GCN5 family acetyltransferase [Colwellia sp. PAMC 20917]MBA6252203.1 GNAT family N-acetyltransferase [Colwellia sp. MB3u-55]MBA6398818.1 GNAT family N-acetyltransferase [Colwellia sp. BRX10-4]